MTSNLYLLSPNLAKSIDDHTATLEMVLMDPSSYVLFKTNCQQLTNFFSTNAKELLLYAFSATRTQLSDSAFDIITTGHIGLLQEIASNDLINEVIIEILSEISPENPTYIQLSRIADIISIIFTVDLSNFQVYFPNKEIEIKKLQQKVPKQRRRRSSFFSKFRSQRREKAKYDKLQSKKYFSFEFLYILLKYTENTNITFLFRMLFGRNDRLVPIQNILSSMRFTQNISSELFHMDYAPSCNDEVENSSESDLSVNSSASHSFESGSYSLAVIKPLEKMGDDGDVYDGLIESQSGEAFQINNEYDGYRKSECEIENEIKKNENNVSKSEKNENSKNESETNKKGSDKNNLENEISIIGNDLNNKKSDNSFNESDVNNNDNENNNNDNENNNNDNENNNNNESDVNNNDNENNNKEKDENNNNDNESDVNNNENDSINQFNNSHIVKFTSSDFNSDISGSGSRIRNNSSSSSFSVRSDHDDDFFNPTYRRMESLFKILNTAAMNPIFQPEFVDMDVYSCLLQRLHVPYFVIDAQWNTIYNIVPSLPFRISRYFVEPASSMFKSTPSRIHMYHCYSLKTLSNLLTQTTKFVNQFFLSNVLNMFIIFDTCTMFHESVRQFTFTSMMIPKVNIEVAIAFVPVLIVEAELRQYGIVASSAFPILNAVYNISLKNKSMAIALADVDGFELFVKRYLKKYQFLVSNDYGGPKAQQSQFVLSAKSMCV